MKVEGKYASSNFLIQQGILLGTDKKCYNKTNRVLNLLTFKEACKALPKIDYLLMFRTLYAKCESCSVEDFENSSIIQLSFVYNKNRKLIVHESKNFEDIILLTDQLAEEFNLRIKDSATDRRNSKWIN